jgi:anti-sigma B factor antagonist
MSLDVTVEKLNDVSAVVTLTGPLSLGTNLKILDTQLQQLIEEGVVRLVLDLTACPYADSSGLGVMVHTHGLAEAKGGEIRLCGVSDRIARMLELTHTQTLLLRDADLAASIAALG